MENTYNENRKSAGETLQDFEDMIENLKPYLPKTSKAEPIKPRVWKIASNELLPFPRKKCTEHL